MGRETVLISVRQAARLSGLGYERIRQLAWSRQIPAMFIPRGRRHEIRIHRERFLRWLEQQADEGRVISC